MVYLMVAYHRVRLYYISNDVTLFPPTRPRGTLAIRHPCIKFLCISFIFHWFLKGYTRPIGTGISVTFSTVSRESTISLPGERHEIAGGLIWDRCTLF